MTHDRANGSACNRAGSGTRVPLQVPEHKEGAKKARLAIRTGCSDPMSQRNPSTHQQELSRGATSPPSALESVRRETADDPRTTMREAEGPTSPILPSSTLPSSTTPPRTHNKRFRPACPYDKGHRPDLLRAPAGVRHGSIEREQKCGPTPPAHDLRLSAVSLWLSPCPGLPCRASRASYFQATVPCASMP